MKTAQAVVAVAAALHICNAWSIVYYADEDCRGEPIGFDNITIDAPPTCHIPKPMSDTPRSARIPGFAEEHKAIYRTDMRKTVRLYDNRDCASTCADRHAIADFLTWDFCASWSPAHRYGASLGSFDVVEMGEMGPRKGVLSDGLCILKHGDEMFFRKRRWRMQQVAAAWFREIPAEEWDPKVHVQNTAPRFVQHGDVDIFGATKSRDDGLGYFQFEEIESWEDEMQVRTVFIEPGDMDYPKEMLDELCADAFTFSVNRDLLFAKYPNIDELCQGFKEEFGYNHSIFGDEDEPFATPTRVDDAEELR